MNKDYQILKADLASLGISRGDTVLIHSSYKSMGGIDGGIETVVAALLSVLGDSGTLIAPTLTYSYVTVDKPVFDYVNTPSCVGAISEYIRLMDGAWRSIHPTHSCAAIGSKADYYIKDHDKDRTPVGENSPFRKLPEDGGKVLMLGCGNGCNTSVHGIEEMAGVSYLLSKEPSPYTIILPDITYEIDYRRHHITQNGYAQRYSRLASLMDMKCGRVHGAESYLIDARVMWDVGLRALKRDEFFFVEKKV